MKIKRIMTAAVSSVMLFAAAMQIGVTADTTNDIVLLSADITGSTVKVTADENAPKSGVIIHASYNDDGSLRALETKELTENSDEVTLGFTYGLGDKLFVWESLKDITPCKAEVETDFLVKYAKVQDLGWSQFVVAQFEDGYDLTNTTLKVDNVDVTSAFTPVTTDGSVVKWEITNLNPAKLEITNTEKGTQTVVLSDNETPAAPTVKTNTTAGYMIAHGPMAIWDYYLTVYDTNGAIRVEPKETTINLTGTNTTDAPAAYSPETELKANGTGTVEIMFNYNKDWEKTWFDAIKNQSGSVELVTYDENKYVLNNHLDFTKTANVPHGNGKVGEIKIALGQDNFRTNGRYYIRVRSEGHDSALVPVHVVNETAPTLSVTANSEIRSGEDVTFKIGNMVYGITNPTYAAELTRPDGKTVELEMITDWYQIGDNLYLYNTPDADGNERNNIPYNGEYTLTVHSNGFKDMSAVFTVSQGEEIPVAANLEAYGIDMMSSATYSGSVSGDSSSGTVSGGQQVSADVKFNADLLINAMIIAEQMGIENDAAQAICDRWNSMTPDTVSAADTSRGGFDWNAYYSAVNNARQSGSYLSFADYARGNFDSEKTTVPHAVKSVLENNLLGDIQYDAAWVGRDCPFMALVKQNDNGEWEYTDKVMVGKDINIICYGTEYLSSLTSVNLNGNSADLTENDYTLSISQDGEYMLLTIKTENQSLLNVNTTNTVTLKAPKYKTNTLYIPYEKEMEQNLSLATDKTSYTRGENGTEVTITVNNSTGDFLKYLDKIEVTAPDGEKKNALSAAAGGTSSYYYEKTGNNTVKLTDSKNTLFADNGEYTIKLVPSQYYNALEKNVTVDGTLKAVPNTDPYITSVDDDTYDTIVKHYLVDFGDNNQGSGLDEWKSAIKSVTVNGAPYTEGTLARDKYTWPTQQGNNIVMELYGLNAFKDDEENTIVIKATGYDDLTLTFTSLADRTAPTFKAKSLENGKYRITFNGTDADIDKYLKRLETVTVGGTRYYSSGISENNIYALVKDEESGLYIALNLASYYVNEYNTTAVKITAKGYTDLEFDIDNGERPIIDPPTVNADSLKTKIVGAGSGSDTSYYRITFTDDTAAEAYLAKIDTVTVGGVSYSDFASGYVNYLTDTHYRTGSTYLDIAANAIPDYETETEITVTATGYNELKFTIDNTAKHMPSAPAKQTVTAVYAPAGETDYFTVSNADDSGMDAAAFSEYLQKITAVTVGEGDNSSYSKLTYGSSFSSYDSKKFKLSYDSESGEYTSLDLTNDNIAENSTTTVTVTAEGYTNWVFTIDTTNLEKASQPALTGVSYNEASGNQAASYSLDFGDDDAYYLARITSVTVGTTEYTRSSYEGYLYTSDTNKFTVSNGKLLITADAVNATGDTTVAITAKGYTDKDDYKITIAAAPQITGAELSDDTLYYRAAFDGGVTDEAIAAYLDKISYITVSGNKYTKTEEEFTENSKKQFKITESEGKKYLDFTSDCVAATGVTAVTVTADMYTQGSFNIGSEDTGLDAPAYKVSDKTESSSYDVDYYKITFTGDDKSEYLNKFQKVTVGCTLAGGQVVGGTLYTAKDYYGYLQNSQYSLSKSENSGYYINLAADKIAEYEAKTTIVIEAEGYKKLVITIDNTENHPLEAPDSFDIETVYGSPNYYTMTFSDTQAADYNVSDYLKNVTAVYVDGEQLSESSIYSSSVKKYYRNYTNNYSTGYSNVYDALNLTYDCVTKPGTAVVKVISKGYRDKEYTIDFSSWQPSKPPAYDGYTENDVDDYIIAFTGEEQDITTFLGRITSVTVGGKAYNKGSYSYVYYNNEYVVSGKTLLLGDNAIEYKGITEVVVKAADYSDLTFTIDTSSRMLLPAPTASEPEYNLASSSYYKDYYRVTLSGDNASGFIDNISAVSVGGVEYSKYSGYYSYLSSSDTNKYLVNTTNLTIDLADDSVEYIGTTEIVIKSKGYEDIKVTIDTTSLGRTTVAAPEIATIKFVDGNYVDYYQVTFESTVAQAYVTSINSITVGDTPYTKISNSSFNYGGNTNAFVAEQVYDNYYIYALRFTNDAVSDTGNTHITVKAKGYENLTFTIDKDGNLVTE